MKNLTHTVAKYKQNIHFEFVYIKWNIHLIAKLQIWNQNAIELLIKNRETG